MIPLLLMLSSFWIEGQHGLDIGGGGGHREGRTTHWDSTASHVFNL